MRIVPRRVLMVLLLAAVAAVLTGAGNRPKRHRHKAPGGIACSTATASGPPVRSADPTFSNLGGEPFGVATARGYAFVADATGALDVLADNDSAPHLLHTISLPGVEALGVTMTADGRYLLIANYGDTGAVVVDVAQAEDGEPTAVLGTLRGYSGGRHGRGAIEVAVSHDGRYAFVSLEGDAEIAVYRLQAEIAGHFAKAGYVGAIPTGVEPVGLAVSPDGRWLYSTSESGAPPGRRVSGQDGSLSVINVATAERNPGHSVVASVSAGCSPVRVALSRNGADVWVTARESDDLLAFSAAKLRAHPSHSLLATVRVGEAPVGLAVVDGGRQIVVADSNRFGASGRASGLMVVNTAAALAHRRAIAGTVRSGLFPREMALEPAGTVLLVGNFASGTLESLHVAAHAQETRLRRAKPRRDD